MHKGIAIFSCCRLKPVPGFGSEAPTTKRFERGCFEVVNWCRPLVVLGISQGSPARFRSVGFLPFVRRKSSYAGPLLREKRSHRQDAHAQKEQSSKIHVVIPGA